MIIYDELNKELIDSQEFIFNGSLSYVEHYLTLEELRDIHPDSFIDLNAPEKSDGLSSEEAKKRLKDGGANVLAPPKRISNLKLFAKQFLYKFWLLLMGAALCTIFTYVCLQYFLLFKIM
uniref:Cation-transporting P-type ATPase N-terminal domain-containing protein n=1 Tax=Meloidogyne enterolobii TaxID=390850 RepID=A0A6V7WXY7_MELEN|nr:unnamed protein product [Meloidogyne enterolobii]